MTDADSDAQLWHQVIEILPAGPDLYRVLTLPPHPPPRPQLLANLATTAAVTADSSLLDTGTAQQGDVALGDLLADRIRDALLGLHLTPLPADRLTGCTPDWQARSPPPTPQPFTAAPRLSPQNAVC